MHKVEISHIVALAEIFIIASLTRIIREWINAKFVFIHNYIQNMINIYEVESWWQRTWINFSINMFQALILVDVLFKVIHSPINYHIHK